MLKQRLKALISPRVMVVGFVFGSIALATVSAGLTIPIPTTGVVTDPREIFTTIGASLGGPVAGIVIGVLASLREPGGIVLASLLAHVSGGLWMGLGYKLLVYQRLRMPLLLLGWAILVFVYYYGFAVTGFVIGLSVFYQETYVEFFGEGTRFLAAYGSLGRGVLAEALLTALVTTLVLGALPRKHRRPLW